MSDDAGRPTLRTLAADTGLAVATVSRALHDAPDIGEATKARVREAAQRLGYRPNRAGVRLRTGKTNVIALVMSPEADVMHHTSRLISSVAQGLRGTAYHLVVMPYFRDEDPMAPIRYLVETGSADGIILNQTRPNDPRVRYLAQNGMAFATHGRTEVLTHPWVDFDNEAFGRLCADALIARGRRHILLIAPPLEHAYAGHMVAGVTAACAAAGAVAEVMSGVTSDSTGDEIEDAVRARMGRAPVPDGIIAGSPTAAMAAVTGVEAAGLRLGEGIDVAAKEAIRFLRRFRPALLVVHEDVEQVGLALARAVMTAIDQPEAPPLQILDRPVDFDWD
jgi:LacI family transcriptional regulator